ncbi:hypothetical protein HZS_1823, partial [Henneguya salminicola]
MPVFRIKNSVYEELCAIKNIFGFEIEPNIEKIDFKKFENEISIKIKLPGSNFEQFETIDLKLILKIPELYPHDLPEVEIKEMTGLNENLAKEITNVLRETTFKLCGRLMLVDLILEIEDYVRDKFFNSAHINTSFNIAGKIDNLSTNNADSSKEISLNKVQESTTNDQNFCINNEPRVRDHLNLMTSSASHNFKIQVDNCEFHHCGICYLHGSQCSERISSYSFRVWKFPESNCNKKKDSDQNSEYIEHSLLHLSETINERARLNHLNVCPHSKAFIYKTLTDIYFFLGTPLDSRYCIPICKYLEGLIVKISEKTVYAIIKQILKGLNFLHNLDIIHGCLYPCNILITCDLMITIRDYGCVNKIWYLWKNLQPVCKSLNNCTKLHHFEKYSQFVGNNIKGDIFYFGLIILSLCECKIYDDLPISIPRIFNPKFKDFISCCTAYSERNRFTTDQLLNHSYVINYQPTESTWMGSEEDTSEFAIGRFYSQSSIEANSRLLKEFEMIRVIGKGAFGVVILAKNRIDSCIYAIKRIVLEDANVKERLKIIKEVQILSRLSHPNIVRYYNAWVEYRNINWFQQKICESEEENIFDDSSTDKKYSVEITFEDSQISNSVKNNASKKSTVKNSILQPLGPIYVYMQMEYCDNRSLREAIESERLYSNQERLWHFFRDICAGLAYIHSQGMIHRDIKPENILISALDQAKIVDFNLATIGLFHKLVGELRSCFQDKNSNRESQSSISRVGTFPYTAPEMELVLDSSFPITAKIDMYSFGIVFFEMCHPPFYTKCERYQVIKKLKAKLEVAEITDDNKVSIIKGLLQKDPRARFSADDLLMTTLYPVPIDDINIGKVIHHLLTEPFSLHSRKLLNAFFIHENNTDITNSYLDQYYQNSPEISLSKESGKKCLFKYLDSFLLARGCVDLTGPTLVPYHHKNIYLKQSSICFIDSCGVRLCLGTTFLPHIFEFVHKYDSINIKALPISRFGGVYQAFLQGQDTSYNHHPFTKFEFYYALVCTTQNTTLFLSECIVETAKVISNLEISNIPNDHALPIPIHSHGDHDLTLKYDLFNSIEVHVNHIQLLITLLRQVGTKDEDLIYLLRKLKNISLIEDVNKRMISLELISTEQPSLSSKLNIILTILNFRGSINEFKELMKKIFKTKLSDAICLHTQNMQSLFDSVSQLIDQNKLIIILNLGLFNNDIWPCDSFIFQIIGIQELTPTSIRSVVLSNGGIYRYSLKEAKYYDDFFLEKLISYEFVSNSTQDCFLEGDDHRIAYSTTNCRSLIRLSRFLHLNKACLCLKSLNSIHDIVLLCYSYEENSSFNICRLHKLADSLRVNPFYFSVYVYNHPLSFESIRNTRDKFFSINIAAVACVMPVDMRVRVFFIEKDGFNEAMMQNLEEAALIIKKNLAKNAPLNDQILFQHNSKHQAIACKNIKFTFLYIDKIYTLSVQKKYQQLCMKLINTMINKFNSTYGFVIVIADLLQEDFSNIVSDLSFDFSQLEISLTTNLQRSLNPR